MSEPKAPVRVNEPVSSYQVLALRVSFPPPLPHSTSGHDRGLRRARRLPVRPQLQAGRWAVHSTLFVQFATLKHVKEIPDAFVRKEMQLKGVIRQVDPNGIFKVEHRPVIGLPAFLAPRKSAVSCAFRVEICF